jgi:uncharacterized protein (DUF2062 family)
VSRINAYCSLITHHSSLIIHPSSLIIMDAINTHTKAGTIGGTMFILLLNILTGDVIRTMIMAAVGATVSFFVSYFWKFSVRLFEERRRKKRLRKGGDEEHHPQ